MCGTVDCSCGKAARRKAQVKLRMPTWTLLSPYSDMGRESETPKQEQPHMSRETVFRSEEIKSQMRIH